MIKGNIFEDSEDRGTISSWGLGTRDPRANPVGSAVTLEDGQTLAIQPNGDYVFTSPTRFEEAAASACR